MYFSKRMAVLLLLLFMVGCGKAKESPSPNAECVATINDYKLTVADFKEDLKTAVAQKYLADDPAKAKRDILEELITRKILVQEAQRENFDKQPSFMKEIERYWEQALIKFFLKQKSQALVGMISADKGEIAAEYNKMKRRLYVEITVLNAKGNIVSGPKTEWFSYGDLPRRLEDAVFSMKVGEEKRGIPYEENMAVVKLINEEPVEVAPLEKVEPEIAENILNKTKEAIFEKWIATLRKNASIKINKKVLDEIEVDNVK
ncbi:MAG: SurA N-terminal domain-containing protein [Candidatus Omnitrophica bacterium]|nr:SurA N-terminal domain-containing protein [Candidatus Omnitrophota bacterium]